MEITRNNFKNALPIIDNAIKSCDFISIDTEFTGLNLPGDEVCNLFDSPAERYAKQRRAVKAFTLIQVGIGCFKKNPSLNKYEASIFNIFVFPSSIAKYNVSFTSQPSSLEFLCRNHFDFNKFIYHGVPFLNRTSVASLRTDLENGVIGHDEIDVNCFADQCVVLSEWLTKADPGQTTEIDAAELGTGLQRWIFEYELLRTIGQIRIKSSDNLKIVVERCPDNATQARAQEQQTLLEKITNEFNGCAVLFDMLVAAKKPIVGQNLLLDMMFFFEKFYEPLPEKYEVFKSKLHSLLPDIYDTKQIAAGMRKTLEDKGCKKFSLGKLYKYFETENAAKHVVLFQPYIELSQDSRRYENDTCLHEAGFDSYAVGIVFIRLAHMQAMSIMPSPSTEPLPYSKHIEAVKPYSNRINIINGAVSYINLNGADPISLRPDWLVVSSKNRFGTLDQLRLLADLTRFGSFDLRPLSSSKALLAVAGHNTAEAMLETSKTSDYYSIRKCNFYTRTSGMRKTAVAAVIAIGVVACAWTWNTRVTKP